MENQSKLNKISTGNIHYPRRDVFISNTKWSENPSSRRCQIFKVTSGSQTKLEKTHIYTKCKQLGLQLGKIYWLFGSKSQLSIENKLLLYKTILTLIWAYGIQL